MTTRLERFTLKAREEPRTRFTSLMGLLFDPDGLRESFGRQDGRKAAGIDGIKKEDYAQGVQARLEDLSARIRRLGYRPQPARRTYIPKGDGRMRPLGVPSFEDRLVQDRLSQILQAIWEPEFLECSYGFRPGRSAHDALRRVAEVITNERTQWVVEADIKGFFDHVSHAHLLRFLEHRIGDPNLLRIIQRFLKAGIMEDGVFAASVEGTPQGGLVSPVLSNIYLHYALDLWFEKRFARQCAGKAYLIRYADDFVACFEREADARAFLSEMRERLAEFDLEIEPSKTALLEFGSALLTPRGLGRQRAQGQGARTFSFLGFTHYVGRSRTGRFVVGRKTDGKRLRKKLKALNARLRELRGEGGNAMVAFLARHLQGHIQYYGVSGNSRGLSSYVYFAQRLLFKWLNRRSQKRSLNWKQFAAYIRRMLPKARILHNLYPVRWWMPQTGSRMV
ncbi:group II intron reverse transcriptase/maturase [Thiorhodovibrio frisius]|uniref:group II intron reverse transcriptase/maturase n=1 Tax=Thiorhodovibrio frisius TaxID=631362 RepID=UPI002B26015D|nr:group II intron reverse transcriptase/maturase [Thiorhodovibrio frisius]WPL23698.1 Group II intron-encoded protein LtrA [Thiorhodovibrio frisius]